MLSMACFDFNKFFLRWRMYLLAVVVAAVVVPILWCVPPLLLEQETGRLDAPDAYRLADLKDAYRRTLAQILGGVALLYGLFLTYRRIKVAEEGHITERFTRAIEQLGHQETAIRLGGIYGLERLAKDSEKDHGPIMEVLTTYVREKAPRQNVYTPEAAEKPPTDIQAILTVIGRRETTGKNRGNAPLNLSGTHLVGADLTGAKLMRTYLIRAELRLAYLHDADLTDADLVGADLFGATLTGADLTRTNLTGAVNLREEQIRSAKNWRKAHLPDYLNYLKDTPEPPA